MSEVKVNKISPRSGTTVTLGDSGDTFTIPSGATINNQGTATNFGATGSASWVTTVKTSTFTAVAGEGYFVNTTGGVVSVNLPAGTAGAVVAVKDYAGTFDTNACTLVRNGSDKIGGAATDAILSTEGLAVTLVFIDSTQGWLVTDSGLQSEAPGAEYVTATGGTITCSGDYRIHTFTGPGTFTVSDAGNSSGSNTVDYMVIAGGGGGGSWAGGGGGAGGYRESSGTASGSYTVSPLGACVSALPVTAQGYPVVVGGGGAGPPSYPARGCGTNGVNSSFSTITSQGGGKGGNETNPSQPTNDGNSGGSGGGGRNATGGTGNTPPVSPPQGNNGGGGHAASPGYYFGGGGGGAGAVGSSDPGGNDAGPGGAGATSSINGTPTARAGGGGGGSVSTGSATGGAGGGGAGGNGGGTNPGTAGSVNTGGGGGGTGATNPGGASAGAGGAGGSGIVVIRYKFQ